MNKEKEEKEDIKIKKDDKHKDKTSSLAFGNPWDFINPMEKWLLDDPWRPLHQNNRWGSIFPKDRFFDRLLNQETKISAIDIIDTGKEYKITAEMPGINKKDLEINVTPNNISICGEIKLEAKEKEKGWLRRERTYSSICRSMLFPEEVDPDKADATLKDGILEIIIEKKNPSTLEGKRIHIK